MTTWELKIGDFKAEGAIEDNALKTPKGRETLFKIIREAYRKYDKQINKLTKKL